MLHRVHSCLTLAVALLVACSSSQVITENTTAKGGAPQGGAAGTGGEGGHGGSTASKGGGGGAQGGQGTGAAGGQGGQGGSSCQPGIDYGAVSVKVFGGNTHIVGATVDAKKDIYLTDQGEARVFRVTAASKYNTIEDVVTAVSNFGSGIAEFTTIGSDLFFVETNANRVFKCDLKGSRPVSANVATVLATGAFSSPGGLSYDGTNNLYLSSLSNTDGFVSKISPSGTVSPLVFAKIKSNWATLTRDAAALYVSQLDNVARISLAGKVEVLVPNLAQPVGLFHDGGSLYIADETGVHRFDIAASSLQSIMDRNAVSDGGVLRVLRIDGVIYAVSTVGLWRLEDKCPPA